MAKPREADLLAAFTILLCATVAYLGRNVLNPDGVSYLDLTDALRRGDWAHFVQGYWSPLYPIVLGIIGFFTGTEGAGMPALAHWVNAGAAATAALVLWRWTRDLPQPFLARAAFATLLLASAGIPRVEAITPDILLLAISAAVCYELLVHQGRRQIRTGVLLGLAFLAKTSAWPWLLALLVVRLWGARDRAARRSVLTSSAVTFAIMMLWILPLSRKENRFTISSAGSLNYCWYIEGCDARTPDTHAGTHRSYHDVRVADSLQITWASFDDADSWTYQPWSDPTEWARGVETQRRAELPLSKIVPYWLELARLTFGLWELPLILGVLAPMIWLHRRPGMWRELTTTGRPSTVVAVAGLIGMLEFVAVHVEPRLVAPFALMFAMGVLSWCTSATAVPPEPGKKADANRPAPPRPWQALVLSSIGLLAALYFSYDRLAEGLPTNARIQAAVDGLHQANLKLASRGLSQRRVVAVGPAIPVMGTAYWVRGHIVAQMLPRSVPVFGALPVADQRRLLDSLFGKLADVVWLTEADGGLQILPLNLPATRAP